MPLAAARVDLWSATSMLATRLTDERGTVTFTNGESQGALAAIVRRIGFLPVRMTIDRRLALEVTLDQVSTSLPEVTVAAVARVCPQEDDPVARDVWIRASQHYLSPSVDDRWSRFEQAVGTVTAGGVADFVRDRLQTGSRQYTRAGMAGSRAGMERRGYVYRLSGVHQQDDSGVWEYPPLYAELAGHFVDELFARRHTFRLMPDATSGASLRFCARNRRESGLDGTLRLDRAGTLVDARWLFWAPGRDREEAGGEVVFAPVPTWGPVPLVSASGLFWRRLPSGSYYQRWQRFLHWTLSPSSEDR